MTETAAGQALAQARNEINKARVAAAGGDTRRQGEYAPRRSTMRQPPWLTRLRPSAKSSPRTTSFPKRWRSMLAATPAASS